jgi:hypothetical protein
MSVVLHNLYGNTTDKPQGLGASEKNLLYNTTGRTHLLQSVSANQKAR